MGKLHCRWMLLQFEALVDYAVFFQLAVKRGTSDP